MKRYSIFALILLGIAFRITGIFNDLWLDELWSFEFVKASHSWLDIFTKFHHDNNHYLNTLFMYLIGPQGDWYYRLLSLVSGVGGLVMLASICETRRSHFMTTLLYSCSYLLVLYSTEARGYGPLIFFLLLGYCSLFHFIERDRLSDLFLFNLAVVLGTLSHLSFIQFYIVAFGISFVVLCRKRLLRFIKLHTFPVIFMALLQDLYLPIVLGSGPRFGYLDEALNALLLLSGMPRFSTSIPFTIWLAVGVACFVIIAALIEIGIRYKQKKAEALFLAGVICLPVILVPLLQPRVIFVRYFMVSILFLLLLLGSFFARLSLRGVFGRLIVSVVLYLYLFGNCGYLLNFFKHGRGNYSEILQYIDRNSPKGEVISIGSDHDFRNGVMFSYYSEKLGLKGRMNLLTEDELNNVTPSFFVKQSQDRYFAPEQAIVISTGRYVLRQVVPFVAESGFTWMVYERVGQ